MAMIGYARVSTGEQTTEPQIAELRAAGCLQIETEQASGADRDRPVLRRVLGDIAPGDTLVVVRIDRLARSVAHLSMVVEQLRARGAHFRSLNDPIDTSSPQGMFMLQILGAVAELERNLIAERTKAGLASARAEGRVGGNPGLRERDPRTLRKLRMGREEAFFERLEASSGQWLRFVRMMRPRLSWGDVTRAINTALPRDQDPWTKERLVRAAKAYVRDGLLDKDVLRRAPARNGDDRLCRLVAGFKRANPDITLEGIADHLEAMHERTPRGALKWQASSVKMMLDRARSEDLL